MAEENKKTIDLKKVHLFALFRQYYAITYSQWSFSHAWMDSRIDVPVDKYSEAMKQYEEQLRPISHELMSRLGLNKDNEEDRKQFMDWYRQNEQFIKKLTDEEYYAFEKVEDAYIQSDFADSTEYEKKLRELNYDTYIASIVGTGEHTLSGDNN